MKFSTLAVSTFLACAMAEVPSGALKLDIKRSSIPLSDANKLKRRSDGTEFGNAIEDTINNKKFYYSTTVQIGNPPQNVDLLLDTGSSDTWVFTPNSKYTGNSKSPSSFFDQTKSSTWKNNNTDFKITYGIGQVSGQWGTDQLSIGGAAIKDLSIGIAESSDASQGIVGIGRPQAEITNKEHTKYANLPLKLYEAGHVESPAFSLYLNDLNSDSGSILFGAVDHSKYSGKLVSLDVSHPVHYGVTVNSITAQGLAAQNILGKPMTAILDSGTTLSYIPSDALTNLHTNLNANPSFTINQRYYCDCNITQYLQFDFQGQSIQVPNYQFLWPISQFVNPIVANVAFPQNSCLVGFEATPNTADYILLGDNVLRSAYIVYDPANSQIALAQADFGQTEPKIELIKGSIPSK